MMRSSRFTIACLLVCELFCVLPALPSTFPFFQSCGIISLYPTTKTAGTQKGKTYDIKENVCKKKQLTNTRASGSDDALRLTPPTVLSLEQALEYIDTDELLEVTPESLRIRKKILDSTLRYRSKKN